MTHERAPQPVRELAHARSAARAAQDWHEADRLRAEIESAGWKIVDHGTDFMLSPAHPPDVVEDGRVRYGSSASVPSRQEEAPTGPASVVLLATAWPDDLDRALSGVAVSAPAGTQLVVVADAPSPIQDERLQALAATGDPHLEIVWTSAQLGHAAALNAGIRRAAAEGVILLDTSIEPTGDFISPLVDALADPTVGLAGGWGIESDDLRRFRAAEPGDVDAIEAYCMAFRRSDHAARGPLDERFRFYRNLDIWWSLVLRDEGPGRPPRRAVVVPDLPLRRHEHRGFTSVPDAERDRLSKRNFYRIIDRFGDRRDLLRNAAVRAR